MANVGVTRKLFIDSRYKVSGSDDDFTVELPVDVECSRTSSFFLASCSFANTYQTVTPFNQNLYFFLQNLTGQSGSKVYYLNVTQIPVGSYTPDTFGVALMNALKYNPTVTWNAASLNFNIEFPHSGLPSAMYIIPSYTEIDAMVRQMGSDAYLDPAYTAGDKFQSVNALLNMPRVLPQPSPITGGWSFVTGPVDLAPKREVYLHSSLANNRTLHVNGARDCIARIPIDVGYGEVVAYRHLGPSDALSCADLHFRTVRFQLRDWAGNLAPTGSFVVIEICFLENDPFTA